MSSKKKKLNWMAGLVIDRTVTVDQARAGLGKKPLRARAPARQAAQKSAGPAGAGQAPPVPPVPRYAGDEEYLRSAFRPMARPAVTKAAVPAPRESPAQILKAMRELTAMSAEPVRPPRAWTPAEMAMLREAEMMSDPQARESFRSGLIARREGGVT